MEIDEDEYECLEESIANLISAVESLIARVKQLEEEREILIKRLVQAGVERFGDEYGQVIKRLGDT